MLTWTTDTSETSASPLTAQEPVLTLSEAMTMKYKNSEDSRYGAHFPLAVSINFCPRSNAQYSSRYRVTCQHGNIAEFVIEGKGTYDEISHISAQDRFFR